VDVDPNTQVLVVYMTRSDSTKNTVYIGVFSVSNGVVELKELHQYNDTRIYLEAQWGLFSVPLSAKKNYPFDIVLVFTGGNSDNDIYSVMVPIVLN